MLIAQPNFVFVYEQILMGTIKHCDIGSSKHCDLPQRHGGSCEADNLQLQGVLRLSSPTRR